jgi:hypothetical protein
VCIHHEIVPWKSAVDGSLKMLGQGALESESLKKLVVHVDALRNLSKDFPSSHFSQELSFVLIKPCVVG